LNLSFLVWITLVWIVVLVPTIQEFFKITALDYHEYATAILCAFLIIPLIEIQKAIERFMERDNEKIKSKKVRN
jgi:Ca2+-transporting ATPase